MKRRRLQKVPLIRYGVQCHDVHEIHKCPRTLNWDNLYYGPPNFLWQRATPVIVGWFADRTCENSGKWYTLLPELLRNFYNIYTTENVAAGRIMQTGGPRVGDACPTPSLTQMGHEIWKVGVELYLRVREVQWLLGDFPRIWCLVDSFCKYSCTEFHENPTRYLVVILRQRKTVRQTDRQTEGNNIHIRRKLITAYRTIGTMGEYLEIFYGHKSPKLCALTIWECLLFRLTLFSIWFYRVSLNDIKSNEFAS